MRTLYTFLLSLLWTAAFATVCPANDDCDKNRSRLAADVEQHIIAEAGLTAKEQTAFLPLYRELGQRRHALHEQLRALRKQRPEGDAACKQNILRQDKIEVEMKQLQKTYHEKFLRVLSPQKVYRLLQAEDQFLRKAFKNAAGKKKHPDGKGPKPPCQKKGKR